jgi:hypothetical protein
MPHVVRADAPTAQLKPVERDRLRYRLETLFNEQDLMLRNQRVDIMDVERQERELKMLKVFERVPLREDLSGLRDGLAATARGKGVKVLAFDKQPPSRKASLRVPSSIYTDQSPPFRLTDDHVAERTSFRVVVQGSEGAVRDWLNAWPEEQLRLVMFDYRRSTGNSKWEVYGHGYRFRDIRFPKIQTRDPIELLPSWAQADPQRFAQEEPMLWKLVSKIQAVTPQAKPLFKNREALMLNGARMAFFMNQALGESSDGARAGYAGR